MTIRTMGAIAAVFVACSGSSGSSNPLVGTWSTAETLGASVFLTETVEVDGDGSVLITDTAGGTCTGSFMSTGLTWSATATTVSIVGTSTCSGSATCGSSTYGCSVIQSLKAGTCDYTLSNSNDTLALTSCTGIDDATFTRM